MSRSLAGQIEEYLKDMLLEDSFIELQRGDLADIFSCVPSQINYVINTRFTPAQGYVVESRRGGGGYLKIVKLDFGEEPEERALPKIRDEGMTQQEAEGVLERFKEERLITPREEQIIKTIIDRRLLKCVTVEEEKALRGRIMTGAISAIYRQDI